MALLGQSSGGFLEVSSSLRVLHPGIANGNAKLTNDSFTQTNPTVAIASTVSTQVDTQTFGALSGSVAFARPDAGDNFVGPAGSGTTKDAIALSATQKLGYRPVGVFANNATGNPFENQPGLASGQGPYYCNGGTYMNTLYETQLVAAHGGGGGLAIGADLTYYSGCQLVASLNGFLMPTLLVNGGTLYHVDAGSAPITAEAYVRFPGELWTTAAKVFNGLALGGPSTVIGTLRQPPDSTLAALVYDQRI